MSIIRRIANLFSRSGVQQEIDEELRAHIEMRVEDNLAAGMTAEQARRDALLRFGNKTVMRERGTAADTVLGLENILRDIRYALRQMRRSPGFAITAVLTLALGIGANVVVFSVLNAMILKPLNVPNSVGLYEVVHKEVGYSNQSYPDYLDYRARNAVFRDMAVYRVVFAGLNGTEAAIKLCGYEASGNYFDLLGIKPALGRFFHSSDEHGPGSAPYVVLSDSLWRDHFHADPSVIGKMVELNKHPFTVIGVAPREFHGTVLFLWPDFWVPMVNERQLEGFNLLDSRSNHSMWIFGQLKEGVTPQQATDNLNAVASAMSKQYPDDDGLTARLIKPGMMGDPFGGSLQVFLSGILLMAFLVLLAACVNLTSIFAARAAERSRELAIRLAIGSTRWRILRQLLMEALLVSIAGGAVGTLLASALFRALSVWQPFSDLPVRLGVTADARVYLVALLLSVFSGMLFGLFPARQVWRTDATHAMKGGVATPTLFRRFTVRDLLLGVQIALCTLLVMGSLVALRGMQRALHAPMGFQPEGVMLASTDMSMAGFSDSTSLPLQKRMLEETARIPGVTAVGTVNELPLSAGGNTSTVYKDRTTDFRRSNSATSAKRFSISPGYLQAAETRLMMGRDFSWSDDAKKPKVALVNETFVRIVFGKSSPIGRRFLLGQNDSYEVVGVVQDGRYDSLTENPVAAMFFPLAQDADSNTTLVVRSQREPAEMAAALNHTLTGINSNLPYQIQSWKTELGFALFPARVATIALGVMGMLAAVLALTGIFGMAAYSVSKRMKELGVRVALGARPVQLMRSVLMRPLVLLLSGSMAGAVMGVLASRLLAEIVYQATPSDPVVLFGVLATMSLLGLLATWVPARRAMGVDPARLLRDE